jgi:predicted signal transduction protein with EAL and GGDEF domain
VALFPQDGQDPDTLLRHADMAMYAAKEAGRDTLRYYTPEMNVLAMERLTLERDLRRALQDDPAQLVLLPAAVDAASGAVSAARRWCAGSIRSGLMLPGEFIPLAERSGLIVELGRWVLAEACAEQARWAKTACSCRYRSICPRTAGAQRSAALCAGLLQRHGLKGALELELTEGALMKEDDHHLQAFNGLVALGCRFALDDFGTGYSSLSRCGASRSAASRSTEALSAPCPVIPTMKPWCAPPCRWRATWAWMWWPKAWKPRRKAIACSSWAAR